MILKVDRDKEGFIITVDSPIFRILQLTDMHFFRMGITDRRELLRYGKMADDWNVHLIVNTGDMFGERKPRHVRNILGAFDGLTTGYGKSERYWAFAWGNHDRPKVSVLDKPEYYDDTELYLENLPRSLYLSTRIKFERYRGPGPYDDPEKGDDDWAARVAFEKDAINPRRFDGFYGGNYRIRIRRSDKSAVWDIFVLNSRRAHHIPPKVLNWMEDITAADSLPSICFYHVPNYEYDTIWNTGNYFGFKREKVCHELDRGYTHKRFRSFSKGNTPIKACFVGHDHVNDYWGVYEGIVYAYGRKSGRHGYGSMKSHPTPEQLEKNIKRVRVGGKVVDLLLDDINGIDEEFNISPIGRALPEFSGSPPMRFFSVFFDGTFYYPTSPEK